MKNPLFVVLGTMLFCAFPFAYGQASTPTDTLKTTLIKPYTDQLPRDKAGANFPQAPSAYFLVPDLSAIRLLNSSSQSQYAAFDLPISDTQSLPLIIRETAVTGPSFQVITSSGKTLPLPALKFYTGKVVGDDASTVALSISDTGIEGLIFGKQYSYTVGRLRNTTSAPLHVVYQTHELITKTDMICKIEGVPASESVSLPPGVTTPHSAPSSCRGVGVYVEVDYQMYLDWGSDAPYMASKILATFAIVAILYAHEDIRIELSELKIWDTPDPFVQADTPSDLLSQYKKYWNARGNAFNGDIAHLLSTHMSRGGVAYYGLSRRNTIATLNDISAVFSDQDSRSFAFSASTGIYDPPLNPLPAFSYNVYLIAHELGHNFGLPHSHSCLWDGGPLDNCSNVEDGACPQGPSAPNGGTIMSYCPNLANGFGPQPSTKMKHELLTAQNLLDAGTNPVQITPAAATVNQYQYTTLDVSHCTGPVLWSDGMYSAGSRTLLPSESMTYYASCLVEGCLSAPAKASVNVVCVKPSTCTISASSKLSTLNGIGSFVFNTLLTNDPDGVPSNVGTFYEDLTCTQHTLLKAGESYPFTLSGTLGNSLFAKIYIDYNGNGQFTDANELVYSGLSLFQHAGNIKIPSTALRGTSIRLRVMVNPLLILNACSLPNSLFILSGKVNDYALTITDSSCPPHLRESVRSGRWDDPLVWSCGTLPTALDQVKINAGHYITLPTDFTGNTANLDLGGVIQSGNNSTLRVINP